MLTVSQIKAICAQYDIFPSKSRGQNFLIDNNIVKKIIEAGHITKNDTIVEVGPGLGVLTEELVERAKNVIAIELDFKVLNYLRVQFLQQPNISIIEGDVLKINVADIGLTSHAYKIISNLPYNITSKFLRVFLELPDNSPQEMILMLQKEVGERIVARPGDMSLLSLMVQFYGEPKILFPVTKNSFWPSPAIDSVVIAIKRREKLPDVNAKDFFRLARMGFASKRKQLHNNLASGTHKKSDDIKNIFKEAGFDEKIRAQDLSIKDWTLLTQKIAKMDS